MLIHLLRSSALVTAVAVGACTFEDGPVTDYREKYPVTVTSETVAVALPATTGAMTAEDETRLGIIVAGYLDRGHGPLTLVAGSRNGAPSFAELDTIRGRLLTGGVPENAIRLVSLPQLPGNVVTLRYERYNALVPTCGDWSSHPGRNHSNDVHSNFGCANQRNMGLMLADPADLVRMRDAQPTDTQNANRVMQRYRKGEPTAATPSPLQIQGGTGIVKQQ